MHNNIQENLAKAVVLLRGFRFAPGLFLGIGPALYKDGEDAGGGDGQQHARDSEEVAHDAYGEKDEEGVQTGGFAYHFGVDVIGVQLLDQEQAPDGGCGVQQSAGKKCGKERRYHAEKWPEIGDYIKHPGNYADEYPIVDL